MALVDVSVRGNLVGGRVVQSLRLHHEDDATIQKWSWKVFHVILGSQVRACVKVPCTCVLKMMLHYGMMSWNVIHGIMGSFPVSVKFDGHKVADPALSGLVFQSVFRQSVAPATPKGFYSVSKRLMQANFKLTLKKRRTKTNNFGHNAGEIWEKTQFLWSKKQVPIL